VLFTHGKPIGLSIGGSSLDEYKCVFDKLHEYMTARNNHYYEINISCPNTPEGQQMSKHPELLQNLLAYMRGKTRAVIGVKLSPDMLNNSLLDFVDLIAQFSKTYVNLGNTTYRKCTQVGLPENAISIKGGGLSGPPLYLRTLEMTKLVAPILPIIATGGVDSAGKVQALLENGATLVGMATAVVQDMYCIPRINAQLAARVPKRIPEYAA
jgi:dihydroorotate dehydrogenase